jgi:hypothetical protein
MFRKFHINGMHIRNSESIFETASATVYSKLSDGYIDKELAESLCHFLTDKTNINQIFPQNAFIALLNRFIIGEVEDHNVLSFIAKVYGGSNEDETVFPRLMTSQYDDLPNSSQYIYSFDDFKIAGNKFSYTSITKKPYPTGVKNFTEFLQLKGAEVVKGRERDADYFIVGTDNALSNGFFHALDMQMKHGNPKILTFDFFMKNYNDSPIAH